MRHPCFYGMDFPTIEELAAGNNDVEEIHVVIGTHGDCWTKENINNIGKICKRIIEKTVS